MNKIVCPKCGGRLTIESLCQYGIQCKVRPDGTLCKRTRRRDYGPTDERILFCEACGWNADEEMFLAMPDKVVFLGEVEE